MDVGDGAQAGLVDLRAAQALRVARAVQPLVVPLGDPHQMGRQLRRALQHVGGGQGMPLHQMPFAAVQRRRLVEDPHRHGGLADIVQQAGLGQDLGVVPPHAGRERGGQMRGSPGEWAKV